MIVFQLSISHSGTLAANIAGILSHWVGDQPSRRFEQSRVMRWCCPCGNSWRNTGGKLQEPGRSHRFGIHGSEQCRFLDFLGKNKLSTCKKKLSRMRSPNWKSETSKLVWANLWCIDRHTHPRAVHWVNCHCIVPTELACHCAWSSGEGCETILVTPMTSMTWWLSNKAFTSCCFVLVWGSMDSTYMGSL